MIIKRPAWNPNELLDMLTLAYELSDGGKNRIYAREIWESGICHPDRGLSSIYNELRRDYLASMEIWRECDARAKDKSKTVDKINKRRTAIKGAGFGISDPLLVQYDDITFTKSAGATRRAVWKYTDDPQQNNTGNGSIKLAPEHAVKKSAPLDILSIMAKQKKQEREETRKAIVLADYMIANNSMCWISESRRNKVIGMAQNYRHRLSDFQIQMITDIYKQCVLKK